MNTLMVEQLKGLVEDCCYYNLGSTIHMFEEHDFELIDGDISAVNSYRWVLLKHPETQLVVKIMPNMYFGCFPSVFADPLNIFGGK